MFDADSNDVETNEEYWIAGSHRNSQDTRFSAIKPTVDDDAREAYEEFLNGAPLPGRARLNVLLRYSGVRPLGPRIPQRPAVKASPTPEGPTF